MRQIKHEAEYISDVLQATHYIRLKTDVHAKAQIKLLSIWTLETMTTWSPSTEICIWSYMYHNSMAGSRALLICANEIEDLSCRLALAFQLHHKLM